MTRARKPSIVTCAWRPRSGSSSRSPTITRAVFAAICERFQVSAAGAPPAGPAMVDAAASAATGDGARATFAYLAPPHPDAMSETREIAATKRLPSEADVRARDGAEGSEIDACIAEPTAISPVLYSAAIGSCRRTRAKLLCPRVCPAGHCGRNPAGSWRLRAAPPMQLPRPMTWQSPVLRCLRTSGALASVLGMLLASCSGSGGTRVNDVQVMSFAPKGPIDKPEPITIRFDKPVIEEALVGKPADPQAITVSPAFAWHGY